MKKIFYFVSIAAIVLGMASCGQNEPEPMVFQFQTATLTEAVHLIITPENNEAEYFYWIASVETVNNVGSLEAYVKQKISKKTYQKWKEGGFILSGPEDNIIDNGVDDIMRCNTRYLVYACRVEPDAEGAVKIISKIASQEFKTQPHSTLPGEFSVSADKTVRFAMSNYVKTDYGFDIQKDQWYYIGQIGPETPYDLHQWIKGTYRFDNDFYVPSSAEWLYIFSERPHADELFAHATVGGVHGIILLPDNWQTPEGISLKTSKEMGFRWNENSQDYTAADSYDGYAQNNYTAWRWIYLEFAGAVFLPAAGSDGHNANTYGWYWSSTESMIYQSSGYAFDFGKSLLGLGRSVPKTDNFAVRFVRPVE